MGNLDIYERCREVPKEAQKTISAGRLRGMTDINPMWRIKKLTELFGPCGKGWYIDNVQMNTQTAPNGEVALNITLEMHTRSEDGEWNAPLFGVGGSMLISTQKGNLYLDDEAWKKAYTDAIGVACKSLGIGADIYWSADITKYTNMELKPQEVQPQPYNRPAQGQLCERCQKTIHGYIASTGEEVSADRIVRASRKQFDGSIYCADCQKILREVRAGVSGN